MNTTSERYTVERMRSLVFDLIQAAERNDIDAVDELETELMERITFLTTALSECRRDADEVQRDWRNLIQFAKQHGHVSHAAMGETEQEFLQRAIRGTK